MVSSHVVEAMAGSVFQFVQSLSFMDALSISTQTMNFSYLALEEVSQNDQGYKVTLTFKRLPHTERIEIVKCLNSDLTDSHKHTLVHQMIQLARAANFTEVLVADIWNPN